MTETASHRITLPNPPIKQAKLYINGEWKSASDGKTRPTISPITETAIADIPEAFEQDVEEAILSARCTFDDDVSVPFGGYKASGFGRECGKEVMENYTHT
jgi:aldehyde dehydrogenase (NAD+)